MDSAELYARLGEIIEAEPEADRVRFLTDLVRSAELHVNASRVLRAMEKRQVELCKQGRHSAVSRGRNGGGWECASCGAPVYHDDLDF